MRRDCAGRCQVPKQYEAIKASELSRGKPKAEAERIAAATYNKNRPKGAVPMGPNYEARAGIIGRQVAKGK